MPEFVDFAAHRRAVLGALGDDEVVLLFGDSQAPDATSRYRPDADVYWLTGWSEPEVVVVLRPGATPFTMFVRDRHPDLERWEGERAGPAGAVDRFGADAASTFTFTPTKTPFV